jgi:predicted dehydrogenase
MVSRSRPDDLDGAVSHYSDLAGALETELSCVFVSNPSTSHLETVATAVRNGCHVFCEKPLSNNLDGVEGLVSLAEEHKRVLFVGYNLRFHACLLEMKRRLDSGEIGKPLTLFLEVGQALPDWRRGIDYRESVSAQRSLGGGALLELSHEIDAAHWLAGTPLENVFGKWGQTGELDLDVEDFASLAMQFQGSASAMVHLDFVQRPGGRRYRIIGSKGTLSWNSKENSVRQSCFESSLESEILIPEAEDSNHSYVAQMTRFLKLVERDLCDTSHADNAINVLKCLDSLKCSVGNE